MKFGKSLIIFLALIYSTSVRIHAQTASTLKINLNKSILTYNDTLNFELSSTDTTKQIKAATIHLWIEELKTGRKWHYKYPMLNGYTNGSLIIDSSLHYGDYALSFLMQKKFFQLKGRLLNPEDNQHILHYTLISKNSDLVAGILPLDNDYRFKSDYMLFQDSANIIFTTSKSNNVLKIDLTNETDSSFVTSDSATTFISIQNANENISDKKIIIPENYTLSKNNYSDKMNLPEVVVKTQSKKLIDQFQQENVSGLFSGMDGTIIDGLESDEMAKANDLILYLTTKVAGLSIKINEEGSQELTWRKHQPDIYINEVKADFDLASEIIPSDIAMIKIFEPGVPVSFGSAKGGTIAIYIKSGIYQKNSRPGNNFKLNGYSGLLQYWKIKS